MLSEATIDGEMWGEIMEGALEHQADCGTATSADS